MEKIKDVNLPAIISSDVPKPPRFGRIKLPWLKKKDPPKRESYFKVKGEKKSERETQVIIDADLAFENPNLTNGVPIYADGNPIKAIREALLWDKGWFRSLLQHDVFNQVCDGSFTDPETPRHFAAAVNVNNQSATLVLINQEIIRIKLRTQLILDFISNNDIDPLKAYEAAQEVIKQEIIKAAERNLFQMSKNGHEQPPNGTPLKARMSINRKAKFRIIPEPIDWNSIELRATNVQLIPYDND